MKHFTANLNIETTGLSNTPGFEFSQTIRTGLQTREKQGDRRKEELALNLHRKNQKKYTHLYELEKYFR